MVAPRLLDKRTVNAEVAIQKKRAIDEGLNLAKKVDALRETKQEEEGRLETFRTQTIARVQKEIDAKILERDNLKRENLKLNEERIKLHAPIDLKEEWEKVRSDQKEIEQWKSNLTNEQVVLLARQGDVKDLEDSLSKRDTHLLEKEKLSERTLLAAEEKFEDASSTFEKAQADSKRLTESALKKEKIVVQREITADERDKSITERELRSQEHEIDLSNRERALTDKYQTFIRAQNYVTKQKR